MRFSQFAMNGAMLCIGGLLLFSGAHRIYLYASFKAAGVAVIGVVDKAASGAGFGGRPLIRYQDLKGEGHIFKSRVKTHLLRAPKPGEAIPVIYLRQDPGAVMVDSRLHYFVLPLLLIVVGAAVAFRSVKNISRPLTGI